MDKQSVLLQSLGQVIAQRRNSLGMSQQELAISAGVHRSYLSDVERGQRNLTISSLETIAAALESDAVTLLLKARTKLLASRDK